MKLLLINPKFPESFWSYKWAVDTAMHGVKTLNPPLGLATVAALTPAGWDVEIVDENVESLPLSPEADVIGICGMGIQFERQKELLAYYRSHGFFVVAGGSYASLCPEAYESAADCVVAGEAEYIWPEFCRDFERGVSRELYRETGIVSLADSPVPRYDLLKVERYGSMSLQFSRGCPFECEFCDIIVMFGRRPRSKSPQQIGAELDALRGLGIDNVFFVDDNLIGNKKAARKLLEFLGEYQEEHDYAFRFGTEVSIDLAYHPRLMELCRRANMEWVFIGIESPDNDSLKDANKLVNMRRDILESVRTIYANGIDVLAGFIIGFDSDDTSVFEKQYRFIVDSGIQSAMIGLLVAIKKTPLYERLEREGRLNTAMELSDNSKLGTNVIPKRMSYDEMISGYRQLHFDLLELPVIAKRIRNKTRYLKSSPYLYNGSVSKTIASAHKLASTLFQQWGWRVFYQFIRSISPLRPRSIPLVIHDWVIALSMRDYVERHFALGFEKQEHLVSRYLGSLKSALQRYLRQGSLEVAVEGKRNANPNLSFFMKGKLGKEFFGRSAAQLDSLLRNTRASLTLHIEDFHISDLKRFRKMLDRLGRYRERIFIAADERSRGIIQVDSSRFTLLLNS